MSELILIPPRLVPAIYQKSAHCFALIAKRAAGRATPEDFARMCERGERQLWIVVEDGNVLAIALSEIVIYPRQKLCRITSAAGEGRFRWVHHLDEIEAWARDQGCAVLQPVVRPGWGPMLKERGYRRSHYVMERRL